jgi:hypothetical protein
MRRRRTPSTSAAAQNDAERVVSMLIDEVRAQRAMEAAASQLHDVKALALLGLDGAAIAGLAAARPQLPSLWWVAVIALGGCMPLFLVTIVSRPGSLGPDVPALYRQLVDRSALEAGMLFLAELRDNMAEGRAGGLFKAHALSAGLALFILGSLFAATFLARTSLVR